MPLAEQVWTIVVGGGSGQRFGRPKQYELLSGDERVLDRAIATARQVSAGVVPVVPAADAEREEGVAGGRTRSESVRAGLAAIPEDATIVCVHDAARPLASASLFNRVIDAVAAGADGAIPGLAVADTIKQVDRPLGSPDQVSEPNEPVDVVGTLDRSTLVAVQTPQAFRSDVLRAAHAAGAEATDDAALVETSGGRVVVVVGEADNRKITTPDDLRWARTVATGETS